MRIHQEASKIYHTNLKNWVNHDWVIRYFFGNFWSFLRSGVKTATLIFLVFLSIFLHGIKLLAIDFDKIGRLEPFLPLWQHFWNLVSAQLYCTSDLTPRHMNILAYILSPQWFSNKTRVITRLHWSEVSSVVQLWPWSFNLWWKEFLKRDQRGEEKRTRLTTEQNL